MKLPHFQIQIHSQSIIYHVSMSLVKKKASREQRGIGAEEMIIED
jgi:hypothetical protein